MTTTPATQTPKVDSWGWSLHPVATQVGSDPVVHDSPLAATSTPSPTVLTISAESMLTAPQDRTPSARYVHRDTWQLALVGPTRNGESDFAPLDVALDADGRTYLADGRRNIVRVLGADGTLEAVWHCPGPMFQPDWVLVPSAIAVDPNGGDVAVLWRIYSRFDWKGSTGLVDIRRRDGSSRSTWMTSSTTDIAFHGPSGDLFMAVPGTIRRVHFSDGKPIGETYTQVRLPSAGNFDVMADGRVVYLSPWNGNVVVLQQDRSSAISFDLGGIAARAVAVDDRDRIYVLVQPPDPERADAPLVLSFDASGRLLRTLTVGELASFPVPPQRWPWTIALGPAGMVLTTGDSDFRIQRYDPAFAATWSLRGGAVQPEFVYTPTRNRTLADIAIAIGAGDAVLVLDNPGRRVLSLTREGLEQSSYDLPGEGVDIAADGADTFVSFPDGQVWRGAPGGGALSPWLGDCDCALGGRLAVVADALFVSQPGDRRLSSFDIATGSLRQLLAPAGMPALWPTDLAASSDGQLVTADVAAGRMQLWNSRLDPGHSWLAGGNRGPRRIAASRLADGRVVIGVLTEDGQVEIRDAGGALIATWRTDDESAVALTPVDIAIDSRGTVYIADAKQQAVSDYVPADATSPTPTPEPRPTAAPQVPAPTAIATADPIG